MKIGGFNKSNWGRRGNDDGDDKKKDNINDKDKVASHDDQDDDDKKSSGTGRRGGRRAFEGLGARMRQAFSDVGARISARLGRGHGESTRGRLGEARQMFLGYGRCGFLFAGLVIARVRSWMSNASIALRGNRRGNSSVNPVPKPPRTFTRGNGPGSGGKTPADGSHNVLRGILKQPGSSSSGNHVYFDEGRDITYDFEIDEAEHRDPLDKSGDWQKIVSPKQVHEGKLSEVANDIVRGVESSGGDISGSPYRVSQEPGDGGIGRTYAVAGSNLVLQTEVSPSSGRMHHLFYGLREWGENRIQQVPEALEGLSPTQLNELRRSLPDVLEGLPEVPAVGWFDSGVVVASDPNIYIVPNAIDLMSISNLEPIRVNFSDLTLSAEIIRRTAVLTPLQYRELLIQAEHVETALRLLPFGGPSLRADIYIPDPGRVRAMPRVVLGGFDQVYFASDVDSGAGGITQMAFNEWRRANQEGISILRRILRNNRGDR